MHSSWRIARIMGIDISIDLSWFFILFLMIYSLGFVEFPRELHPRTIFPRVDALSIVLGVGASLLLFASVLAHELSHSWMAIQRGIPVAKITLFIFGGVAQIADEPDRPATEFLIAIMGPLMSLALAAVFGAAWLWLRILDPLQPLGFSLLPFVLVTGILAQANGALALFNLAPGFPLDGGRVLRAILWGTTRDIRRATRWATRAGQVIALGLVGLGALQLFLEFDGSGIWYALIGMFLWNAAGEGYRQTVVREALRQVSVSQVMTRQVETVPPDITISEFVSQFMLPRRDQTFAVSDGQTYSGTISSTHLQKVPLRDWSSRCVRDAMTPRHSLESLSPQDSAAIALGRLARSSAEELAVVDADEIVGFLGRSELMRFLRLRIGFEKS